MTTGVRILENDGRVQVTASGGQTSLAFDFPIYDEAHIRIIRTRSGADTTLALTTDYTVPSGSIGVEAGGVVTLNAGATAGDIYTLLLDVPYARTTDFIQAGDFLTETLNQELDLLTQQNQQIVRDAARAAKIPESSTISDLQLPAPQASKLIGWNNLATGMTNYGLADLSSSVVTSFAQTLLDDADAATARATLGISGGTVNNFSATTAPTVNEDSGDGYVVGSEWIDVTNDRVYICLDNTIGAAVWRHQVDTTSTQTLTNKSMTMAAGTTSLAPITFTSGTNLTTATAGSVEYDGKVIYATPQGAQRGVVPTEQFYSVNTAIVGTNGTGVQNIFGVGVTLSGSTIYEFESAFAMSKSAGTTSHGISLLFGGTATFNNIGYQITGDISSASFTSGFGTRYSAFPQVASAIASFASLTSANIFVVYVLKGTVSVNAGGTFIPQYQLSAAPGGAYSTAVGSYFKIKPIGTSGANVSVGAWA